MLLFYPIKVCLFVYLFVCSEVGTRGRGFGCAPVYNAPRRSRSELENNRKYKATHLMCSVCVCVFL